MTLIIEKLIVFKTGKSIFELHTYLIFLSTGEPVALGTDPIFFLMNYRFNCFGFYLMRV